MVVPRVRRHVAQLRQQGIRNVHRLNKLTHGWLRIVASAAQATLKPESGIMAAAIA